MGTVTPERQILAMGGFGSDEAAEKLVRHALDLSGKERPRLCYVGTANNEEPAWALRTYDLAGERTVPSHLDFFPWPPEDLRAFVLGQDVVFVDGGNTANMLAIWRVHGMDAVIREAWENGIVLCGVSAGMICWFEAGVTDSFGPQLEGMDCLGFLPGSACPHYDGEEQRRPRYHELVRDGFRGGLAADDGVALHFRGAELAEVVGVRDGASAYRVELVDGEVRETQLDARRL